MIDIILDCSTETNILLKEKIKQFNAINFIQYEQVNKPFILIKEINQQQDIEMIKKLNSLPFKFELICIIASGKNVLQLLDIHKVHLLRSYAIDKDVSILINVLQDFQKGLSPFIQIISNYEYISINIHTILYIESIGHNIFIHCCNGTFKCCKKLSTILKEVEPFYFYQIHKSYIINSEYILSINTKEVTFQSKDSLPIGRKYKDKLKRI